MKYDNIIKDNQNGHAYVDKNIYGQYNQFAQNNKVNEDKIKNFNNQFNDFH